MRPPWAGPVAHAAEAKEKQDWTDHRVRPAQSEKQTRTRTLARRSRDPQGRHDPRFAVFVCPRPCAVEDLELC